jgi:hypothetical protein
MHVNKFMFSPQQPHIDAIHMILQYVKTKMNHQIFFYAIQIWNW